MLTTETPVQGRPAGGAQGRSRAWASPAGRDPDPGGGRATPSASPRREFEHSGRRWSSSRAQDGGTLSAFAAQRLHAGAEQSGARHGRGRKDQHGRPEGHVHEQRLRRRDPDVDLDDRQPSERLSGRGQRMCRGDDPGRRQTATSTSASRPPRPGRGARSSACATGAARFESIDTVTLNRTRCGAGRARHGPGRARGGTGPAGATGATGRDRGDRAQRARPARRARPAAGRDRRAGRPASRARLGRRARPGATRESRASPASRSAAGSR